MPTELDTATSPSATLATWFQQGLALHRQGQIDDAQALYKKILAVDPQHADALHLLGVIAAQSHDPMRSEALIAKAIAINPNKAAYHSNLGLAHKALHRLDEAAANFDKAIALQPDYPEAYANRGLTLYELHRLEEALACFDKAIELKPDFVEALFNRGKILNELKRAEEALACFDKVIELKSDHAEAFLHSGYALTQLNRTEEALSRFNQACVLAPDFVEAFYNSGLALQHLKRTAQAIACYDEALALKSDFVEALYNRGVALQALNRFEEAMASYDQATALQPAFADAHVNRGMTNFELRHLEDAIACYDQAIEIQPDHVNAQYNKAWTLLLMGQYQPGWALHEWRKKLKNTLPLERQFPFPLWLGQDSLTGKTILLHAEQGLGDTLQFCRYAKLVKNLGAHVILEVPSPLLKLLQSLTGVDIVSDKRHQATDRFDYHCPLMSLPLAFDTTLASIPDAAGYLTADPDKVRVWQDRLGPKTRLRVGVVWNGGNRPNQPELQPVNERRNIDLHLFASALQNLDADFYSLQKGDPAESQIRGHELAFWPKGNFHNHASALNDFSDTAALIANLDLVVSVDTSTAHLAAALGKLTWILNRYDSCWRWLLDRDDSPWYASVKLYRQDNSRRWEPVLQRLADDLRHVDNTQRPTPAHAN